MPSNINEQEDISKYYPDGDAANIERDDHDDAFLNQNMIVMSLAVSFSVFFFLVFEVKYIVYAYKHTEVNKNGKKYDWLRKI